MVNKIDLEAYPSMHRAKHVYMQVLQTCAHIKWNYILYILTMFEKQLRF